jgi:hypothetical protein
VDVVDLLTIAVLAFVGLRLFEAAQTATRGHARAHAATVVRGLRVRHFVLAIPALIAVLGAAVALLQVPGLDFGWWTALGGVGNPVIGATNRSHGALDWLVPALFLTLLVVALPVLVEREERVFRLGAEHRTRWENARRSLLFGLAHAVVGIPIGAALALSLGGIYLTWSYRRGWQWTGTQAGAMAESTRAHLAYNIVILVLVVPALALGL